MIFLFLYFFVLLLELFYLFFGVVYYMIGFVLVKNNECVYKRYSTFISSVLFSLLFKHKTKEKKSIFA